MNENKNKKLSEILEKYKNLPITDDISTIAQCLYNKTADKMKSLADKYKNDVKVGTNSCINNYKNVTATKEKIVFSEPNTTFDANSHLTSDDIIQHIPSTMPIDGDDCVFNLTMMVIDEHPQYVVTYDRRSDGWTCKSFYGDTLRDVLTEVAVFASED